MSEQASSYSIVVATKGRVQLLKNLLESIAVTRDNYPGDTETIIVDDTTGEERLTIEAMCEYFGANLITFMASVAQKRNFGVARAAYEKILFIDSDCRCTPHLIEEHEKKYTSERVAGVAGLLTFVGTDTTFWKIVDKTPYVICFSFPGWLEKVPWTPTANFSVRKEVFQKVDGFDKAFPDKPGGEDVDIGLRITALGYDIACSKEGEVLHDKITWGTPKSMIKRLWHYGSADCYLVEKHPSWVTGVLPRKPLLYALFALLIVIVSMMKPWAILALAIWPVFDLLLNALLIRIFANYKKSTFLQQICVQFLMLCNELGYVFRCLVRKKNSNLFKQMVYFDGQLDGILYNGAVNSYTTLISVCALVMYLFLV